MAATEWSERTKLLITAAAVVVVNIGIWGLAYKVRGDWQVEEGKLKKLQSEINVINEYLAQREQITAKRDESKRKFDKKEKMLPEKHERDKFMEVFTDLAQKKNFTIKSNDFRYDANIDVQGIPDPQNFRRDIWSVAGSTDFKGICELLNVLEERFQRFVSIEALAITTDNLGMNVTGTKHNISFQIMIYRYVEQAAP